MDISLLDIAVSTGVAKTGMTIGQVFKECVMHNVPGIPYCDKNNRVVGRISIRHTLKISSTPGYLVGAAHLLGDDIWHLSTSKIDARSLLDMPVEKFVLENIATVTSVSPIVKALAIMEKYNTGYVFLVDAGIYKGIVTRMGVAKLMLKAEEL
ncbi:MAG: CBS domain-containing protein [bacterium]|nr:CBS domain-containing protein [bacterium]